MGVRLAMNGESQVVGISNDYSVFLVLYVLDNTDERSQSMADCQVQPLLFLPSHVSCL